MKMQRFEVPSNLSLLLGIDTVRKTADVDCYREQGIGPAQYRAKIDGRLMRTKAGTVRKFRTMNEAIKATEIAP